MHTACIKCNFVINTSVDNKAQCYSPTAMIVWAELLVWICFDGDSVCMPLKCHLGDSKECVKFWDPQESFSL